MKKIAIIEIYSHHVFVDTISTVLANSGYHVDVYLSNKVFLEGEPLFLKNNINYNVSSKNESDYSFLRRIKPNIEANNDLLIINTIQGSKILLYYLVKFNIRTIAGAGRISEFFRKGYKFAHFDTFRDLAYYNYSLFFLRKIIQRLDGIIVHTQQANDYAISNGFNKPIHKMPFALNNYNNQFFHKTSKNVNFIVTGAIENISRDIEGMLDAFELAWAEIGNFNLTILSRPKGRFGNLIIIRMREIAKKGFPIKFYDSWIPEDIYNNELAKADFIIAPIKKNYYGSGELTSATVESIKHSIPAIYPDWYRPEPKLENCSLYFSTIKDLKRVIVKLCNEKDLVSYYKKKSILNFKDYRFAQESKKITAFLNENKI